MNAELDFANLTGRPPGRLTTALGRIIPGVAAVHAQELPYARAWHAANLQALAGDNRRWIVFGDSMSQGLGASRLSESWVSQLANLLPVSVDVINLSETGARVADVINTRIPVWRGLSPPPGGEFVTVLIGSNDLFARGSRHHLPQLFAKLLSRLPDRAIVATLPSPGRIAGKVNAVIDAARVSRDLRVVDTSLLGASSWRGRLAADHFHPNDHGYAEIARTFEPAVIDAVTERRPPARPIAHDGPCQAVGRHDRRDRIRP